MSCRFLEIKKRIVNKFKRNKNEDIILKLLLNQCEECRNLRCIGFVCQGSKCIFLCFSIRPAIVLVCLYKIMIYKHRQPVSPKSYGTKKMLSIVCSLIVSAPSMNKFLLLLNQRHVFFWRRLFLIMQISYEFMY